jgi:hypothetical protein
MKQTVLTIITEIDPQRITPLKNILTAIESDLCGNSYLPFSQFSLLHFASFVIIDQADGHSILVFENNFDGDLSDYLDQLLSVAGNGMNQIYQCCNGYQQQTLKAYLTAHVVRPNAYHIGNVGRTSVDISANRDLRIKLQDYLDHLFNSTKPSGISATNLRQKIQQFAKASVAPGLSAQLPPHQTFSERIIPWINLIALGLLLIVLALGLFPITLILIIILRQKERHDKPWNNQASPEQVNALMKTENQIAQNHLASITDIKPGTFRLYLLKFVLFAVNVVARTCTKGTLSGIPSIHFAHWAIINDKQLLFFSNFDGSWVSYLDDFIDKAATGLTGVWTNSVGFPETRFLVLDGARDELHFKAFARNMQVPSMVWYSAHPDLTVQNIDRDSAIREGMWANLSETETKQWLKLF